MSSTIYNNRFSIADWLKYHFITKKLNTPVGYFFLAVLGVLIAFTSAFVSYKLVMILLVLMAGLVLAVASVLYPYFGFYWCIVLSVLIFSPERIFNISLPYGIIVEIYTYFTLLGVLTQRYAKEQIHREFWRHPITVILIVLFLYYTLEAANPYMFGYVGWFNYWRKFISFLSFYFISYCLINDKRQVWFFLKFFIIVSTILALYTWKQHLFGLTDWELKWIMADERRYELYFQHGFFRKFSLLPDPAASGALFSSMSVLMLILALRTHNNKHKLLLYLAAFINMLAFSFSGTRTANLMLVAGLVFYCVVTIYEKTTIRFAVIAMACFIMILVMPVYNPVLFRIRTTFSGSKDPSALLRIVNRKSIQPYIYSHPIGGGIYTSGIEGSVYNSGHRLSRFQPDSGYLKIAIEQGTIGFALTLIFYYLILRTGIKNFFRTRDPVKQNWYICILCMLFALLAGQYSQIVIGQYPTIFFFFASLVVLIKLIRFENSEQQITIQ